MMKYEASMPSGDAAQHAAAPFDPQRVTSAALFGSLRELVIVHNGREYRLRLTQRGRLILTA